MNSYTLHITLFDFALLGATFIGLCLSLQLGFAKKNDKAAARFLGLALLTMVLGLAELFGSEAGLEAYLPYWNRLPLQWSLAPGPLIYFYVLKLTRPGYRLTWKDWLHFIPAVIEQTAFILETKESLKPLHPGLLLPAFCSVMIYLYFSAGLIELFYRRQPFNPMNDRYRVEMRWLRNWLFQFGALWSLWIPYAAQQAYSARPWVVESGHGLLLLLACLLMRLGLKTLFKENKEATVSPQAAPKPLAPAVLKQKGSWLKRTMESNLYYRDPDLTLRSLAETLHINPNDLSRIINTVFNKNFNDYINEYRIREVARKNAGPGLWPHDSFGDRIGRGLQFQVYL
ncbi:hypothetical protein ACFJIV_12040 [Mucilaginibacter sp. UC70_90]